MFHKQHSTFSFFRGETLYGLILSNHKDKAKAENVLRRFTGRAKVNGNTFLYSERPVKAKVCMFCMSTEECPQGFKKCPIEEAIQQTLIGFEALRYVHVKAKIIFPAP